MKFSKNVLLSSVLLLASTSFAEDWPNFRGSNYDGISKEAGLKLDFTKNKPKRLWMTKVNTGFSSITTSKGKVYTMGHKSGKDYVYCLDERTGRVVWSKNYPAELSPNLYEGGPNSTPTIYDGMVYTLGKQGQVNCYDARSGRTKWSDSLEKYGYPRPDWGFSGSPYISGDLVIINGGEYGIAYNRKTGKVAWRSPKGSASYSTPVPYGDAILHFGADKLVMLDPKSGKLYWDYGWKTSYKVNSADPIIDGNTVFISSGYGRGATLLKIGKSGAQKIWENKQMRNQFSSSVLYMGHVYGIDGNTNDRNAGLKCIELKTGREKWTHDLGFGSLTMVGDTLLVLRERGQLISIKADPNSYKEQGKLQILGGKCWTSPIVSNGKFFARNAKGDLVCLSLK